MSALRCRAIRGIILGLGVGIVAMAFAFTVALQCLPYRISFSPQRWEWYCADPVYHAILYLAFPVNALTNDLTLAIYFAPLSLAMHAILGVVVGYWVGLLFKVS